MKKLFFLLLLSLGLFGQPGYEGKSGYSQNVLWRDLHPSTQDSISAIVTGSSVTYNSIVSLSNEDSTGASTVTPSSVAGNLYNIRFRTSEIITLSIGASDRVVGADKGEDIVLAGGNGMEYKLLWVDDTVAVLTNDGGGRTNAAAGVYDLKDMRGYGHDSIAVRLVKDAIEARGSGEMYVSAGTYDVGALDSLVFSKKLVVRGEGPDFSKFTGVRDSTILFDVKNSAEIRGVSFENMRYPIRIWKAADSVLAQNGKDAELVFDDLRFDKCLVPIYGKLPNTRSASNVKAIRKATLTNSSFDSTNYGFHQERILVREFYARNLSVRHLYFPNNEPNGWEFAFNRELRFIATGFEEGSGRDSTKVTIRDVTIDSVNNARTQQTYLFYHSNGDFYADNVKVNDVSWKDTTGATVAAFYIRSPHKATIKNSQLHNCSVFFGAIAFKGGAANKPHRIIEGNMISVTDAYEAAISGSVNNSTSQTYGIKVENPSGGFFNIRGNEIINTFYGVLTKTSNVNTEEYHISNNVFDQVQRGIEVASAARLVRVATNTMRVKERGVYVTGEFGISEEVDVIGNHITTDSANVAAMWFLAQPRITSITRNRIIRLADSMNTVSLQDSGLNRGVYMDTSNGIWRKGGASGGEIDTTNYYLTIADNEIKGVDYNTRFAIDVVNCVFQRVSYLDNNIDIANQLYKVPNTVDFEGRGNISRRIRLGAVANSPIVFNGTQTNIDIDERLGQVRTYRSGKQVLAAGSVSATVTHQIVFDTVGVDAINQGDMQFRVTFNRQMNSQWISNKTVTQFTANYDTTGGGQATTSDTLWWEGWVFK